jgi:hypothetical protein
MEKTGTDFFPDTGFASQQYTALHACGATYEVFEIAHRI